MESLVASLDVVVQIVFLASILTIKLFHYINNINGLRSFLNFKPMPIFFFLLEKGNYVY